MSSSFPPPPPAATAVVVQPKEGATSSDGNNNDNNNHGPREGAAAEPSQSHHPLLRDETAGMNPVALLTGFYGPRRGERIRHVVHEGALRLPASVVGGGFSTAESSALLGPEATEAWMESNRPKPAKGKTARFVLPSLESGVVRPSLDPDLPSYTVTTVQREEVVDEEQDMAAQLYNPADDAAADAAAAITSSIPPPALPKRAVYRMVSTNRTFVQGQRIRGGGGGGDEEEGDLNCTQDGEQEPTVAAGPNLGSISAATATTATEPTAAATAGTEQLSSSSEPTPHAEEAAVPAAPPTTATTNLAHPPVDPSPSTTFGMTTAPLLAPPPDAPAAAAALVSTAPLGTATARSSTLPAVAETATTTKNAVTSTTTSTTTSVVNQSVVAEAGDSGQTLEENKVSLTAGTPFAAAVASLVAVPVSSNSTTAVIVAASTVTSMPAPTATAEVPPVASAAPRSNIADIPQPATFTEVKPALVDTSVPFATTMAPAVVPSTAQVPTAEETKSSSTAAEQPQQRQEEAKPAAAVAVAVSTTVEPPPEPRVLPLDETPVPQWHQHKASGESDDATTSTNVLILTPKPSWYHPDQVSALERALLPEWFDGSAAHRTGSTYLETRNAIVDMAAALGHTRFVTGTLIRRSIPGDAGSLLRLHALLTAHRVINADAINDSMPTPAAFLLPRTVTTTKTTLSLASSNKTAAVWQDQHRKHVLMEAVVEQANKRMKLDDDNHDDDEDESIIDWEAVAATVGNGVTALDCQGQFLALPLDDDDNAPTRDGSITPDAAALPNTQQIEHEFVTRLVQRADPGVLRRVTQTLLRSTTSNNQDDVTPPSSSATAAAVLGLAIQQATPQASDSTNVAQLLSELVELRMQKLENRLAMLDDVEGLLDAERLALELERRDLYTARCRHWFGGT